ncbi:hypothetical protein Tco_0139542 [Tanacetum coccineum]
MESSNSNSKERELQLTQRLAKQRHSNCMTWFEQLETHLHDLYLLNSPYAVDAFKPAFRSFFGEEHQTFKLKMFHNLDQLRLQLERENLHGVNAKTCLQALRTQFKEFLASKGVNATDLLNQGWQQDFEDFTRCEPSAYRRELLENLDTLEAVIHRVVNTYGVLRMKENELNALKENGSQLHDEILHEHQIKSSVKMQSQDIQINPVQAMDDSLIVSKSSLIEPENNNAFSKSEIETQMQRQEEKVNMREAVDAGLVVTESSGTKPDKQDTSSSSGNYTTQAVDADIGPVNDEEPFAEVQLTALHNILANEQQHTEQSEPSYDTHLLETIDSNTTPTSTNMCHRGGEIDQDALLNAELLKTKDMVCMEVYNELSKRFLQLEKHCISLESSIQQKKESFHSNKPCKNKEYPEFCKFFVINDLKAQLQAKTTLICDLKNQIKSVKEASNEAKVKNDIDVIETINIELEHSVAKLLAANEQLHKEKEHLKQTYKELYDTIKKTRIQNKDKSGSVKPKVLVPGMYAIDVKPIPHPFKNNRSAHLNYISHLKESVETVKEIVEEARVVKPLDNALNYACQYTKLSQELLEYVIGTCPKSFNERDNKAPSTPVTRKKQVTFNDKRGTLSSNTQKHEVHQKVQQTNIPVIHSTGVNTSTRASGSKPRSNTKHNRILPAKSVDKYRYFKNHKKTVKKRASTDTRIRRVQKEAKDSKPKPEKSNPQSNPVKVDTIELPDGNNVVPLRSDTIWLVQNGCSFHGLRSEDPNHHLKDFLKLVDSLNLYGDNKERMRLCLFHFLKHGLVSRTYSKKSLIMASIFGSKSKSFMTMSIPSQGEPSINQPVASFVIETSKNPRHY